MISCGIRRGLLLPQVAVEYRWTRERFLEETCRKAGLLPDAWQDPETQIEVFTAEVFSESDFRAEIVSRATIERQG
jgi:AMMECR1 domain-containing protein